MDAEHVRIQAATSKRIFATTLSTCRQAMANQKGSAPQKTRVAAASSSSSSNSARIVPPVPMISPNTSRKSPRRIDGSRSLLDLSGLRRNTSSPSRPEEPVVVASTGAPSQAPPIPPHSPRRKPPTPSSATSPMHTLVLKQQTMASSQRRRRAATGAAAATATPFDPIEEEDDERNVMNSPSKRVKFSGQGIDLERALGDPPSPITSTVAPGKTGLKPRDSAPPLDPWTLILDMAPVTTASITTVSPQTTIPFPPLTDTGPTVHVLPRPTDRIALKMMTDRTMQWSHHGLVVASGPTSELGKSQTPMHEDGDRVSRQAERKRSRAVRRHQRVAHMMSTHLGLERGALPWDHEYGRIGRVEQSSDSVSWQASAERVSCICQFFSFLALRADSPQRTDSFIKP